MKRGKIQICARTLLGLVFIVPAAGFADDRSTDVGEPVAQLLNEVVVASTPLPKSVFELAQPVSILDGDKLLTESRASLGETLSTQPGVASTSFGKAASRPVIRGQGGDRIRILQNGTGVQDASSMSPDHAVGAEPIQSDRIEIVRGPATLLFGPNAVGGIVNIIDNRIPEALPDSPASGALDLRGATVDGQRNAGARVDLPLGSFALHLDGFARKSDNYRVPHTGRLLQSFNEGNGATAGASYIFDTGFIGVAFNAFNSNYGVPNGEPNVSIDLEQRRYDIRGRIEELPGIQRAEFRTSISDYTHTEYEGADVGTIFSNNGIDSRVEIAHQPVSILERALEGVIGAQYQYSDFAAVGDEAFQPPSITNVFSGFIFEELPIGDAFSLQAGSRMDWNDIHTAAFLREGGVDSVRVDPATFSAALGAVYKFNENYAAALSVSRTERAPSSSELFANGPHLATDAFELGDPDLGKERALGFDLSLKKRTGAVTGSLGGFYNRFNNYISLNPTGGVQDGLTEFAFEGVPADFFGGEAQLAFHLFGEMQSSSKDRDAASSARKIAGVDSEHDSATNPHHLDLITQLDFVRAYVRDGGGDLPRIPPWRLLVAADYRRELLGLRLETLQAFRQTETSEFETGTASYNLVNFVATYDLPMERAAARIFFRLDNIFDQEARNHLSFIKELAPLPGRNFIAGVRFTF